MGLLCAEQDVGNLNKWTLNNYGTPVRRTRRRKSKKKWTVKNYETPLRRTSRRKSKQKMTSRHYGMPFQEFWDSIAQNKTSGESTTALSEFLGLLCEKQHVGNLKNCTVINSGTPVRRGGRPSAAPPLWFPLYWLCTKHMS